MIFNFIISSTVLFFSSLTLAATFSAGVESKTAGVDSTLKSKGPPAVLYNPANLSLVSDNKKAEPYMEFGIINVNYMYEHPDFDPVQISVSSPIATFGYTGKLNDKINYGFVLFPKSGGGETKINALPKKIGGSVMPIAVTQTGREIDIGLGMSYTPMAGLSVGLSNVISSEKHTLQANLIDNENDLVNSEYQNNFFRTVMGVSYKWQNMLTTSASYKPALTKTYKGSQTSAAQAEASAPKTVNYEPETLGFGASAQVAGFSAAIEMNRLNWSKGRSTKKDGINENEPDADLNDVTEQSLSFGYNANANMGVNVSYAKRPTPWGDGFDDGTTENQRTGVAFGALNGIEQHVYSVGGSMMIKDYALDFGLSRAQGERFVQGQGENLGYYYLDVTTITGSMKASF